MLMQQSDVAAGQSSEPNVMSLLRCSSASLCPSEKSSSQADMWERLTGRRYTFRVGTFVSSGSRRELGRKEKEVFFFSREENEGVEEYRRLDVESFIYINL